MQFPCAVDRGSRQNSADGVIYQIITVWVQHWHHINSKPTAQQFSLRQVRRLQVTEVSFHIEFVEGSLQRTRRKFEALDFLSTAQRSQAAKLNMRPSLPRTQCNFGSPSCLVSRQDVHELKAISTASAKHTRGEHWCHA
jgi:hypothetical protein